MSFPKAIHVLIVVLIVFSSCRKEDVAKDICEKVPRLEGQMLFDNEECFVGMAQLSITAGRDGTDAYNFHFGGLLLDCTFGWRFRFTIETEKGSELGGTYPIGNPNIEGIDKLIHFNLIREDIVGSSVNTNSLMTGTFKISKVGDNEYSFETSDLAPLGYIEKHSLFFRASFK